MRRELRFAAPALGAIPAYLMLFVLACAPLPFGSHDQTTVAFWCIVLGLALVLATLTGFHLRRGQILLLGGIGLVTLFYVFVLHEQLADHPWIAAPNLIWPKTSKLLGTDLVPSVSIVRGEPFFALGPTLACLLALTCGLIVGADRMRARQVLVVIAWSGAAYAIYGVISLLVDPTVLLWQDKRAYVGNVTGTFVNRNTAAAYFGSCAVIWLALLLEPLRRHLKGDRIVWRKVPARLLTRTPEAVVVSFAMLFVCLIAMFLTGSRAGVVLSLFALATTFVVYFRRDLPPRSGLWMAIGGSALFVLALLQFMGGVVSNRFDVQGLADEGRIEAYRSTLRMIADHPWFGTGLGTFAWAFPAYRSPDISMWGVWDMAHNTPLQLAAEVGLPLTLVVALGWLVMFAVLIRGILIRQRDRIIPLAAFSVSMIAVLHSCVDFTLQVPGYAIVAFGILGAGLSQSFASGSSVVDVGCGGTAGKSRGSNS
ncbi:MAG: O-antigen ligase domain-containing protein [Rhodopseudomonas sp.]|nr:O-antigen ligase domain-containing protein [Rhodopseudomonas sp.]